MDDLSNTEKMLKLYVKLTPKQKKIVDALGSGLTKKQVCKLLKIGEDGLSHYINRMYKKFKAIEVD